jgi:hypothetical protein
VQRRFDLGGTQAEGVDAQELDVVRPLVRQLLGLDHEGVIVVLGPELVHEEGVPGQFAAFDRVAQEGVAALNQRAVLAAIGVDGKGARRQVLVGRGEAPVTQVEDQARVVYPAKLPHIGIVERGGVGDFHGLQVDDRQPVSAALATHGDGQQLARRRQHRIAESRLRKKSSVGRGAAVAAAVTKPAVSTVQALASV